MLRAGAPLAEIGQVLRHRSAAADRHLREGRCRTAAAASPGPGRPRRHRERPGRASGLTTCSCGRGLGFKPWADTASDLPPVRGLPRHSRSHDRSPSSWRWPGHANPRWSPRSPSSSESARCRGFARYLHAIDASPVRSHHRGLLGAPRRRPAPFIYPARGDRRGAGTLTRRLRPPLRAVTYRERCSDCWPAPACASGRPGPSSRRRCRSRDWPGRRSAHAKFDRMRLVPLHPTVTDAAGRLCCTTRSGLPQARGRPVLPDRQGLRPATRGGRAASSGPSPS